MILAPTYRFVVDSAPDVVLDAVVADEDLIDAPAPEGMRPAPNALFSDFPDKQKSKTVPAEANGLMADVDAPLEQDVRDLAERQRVTDGHHYRVPDRLRRAVEASERISLSEKLCGSLTRLTPNCSGIALP